MCSEIEIYALADEEQTKKLQYLDEQLLLEREDLGSLQVTRRLLLRRIELGAGTHGNR